MTTQPDKPVYFMPQFMVYNGFDSSASRWMPFGLAVALQRLFYFFASP